MRNFLFALAIASFSLLSLSALADDGKVCPVEGGSVQAELTSTPVAKGSGTTWEYEVTFVLMNSSPNYVNATYVIRDSGGKNYSSARVLVEPQKKSAPIAVKVTTRSNKSTFVVDVVGADCKKTE